MSSLCSDLHLTYLMPSRLRNGSTRFRKDVNCSELNVSGTSTVSCEPFSHLGKDDCLLLALGSGLDRVQEFDHHPDLGTAWRQTRSLQILGLCACFARDRFTVFAMTVLRVRDSKIRRVLVKCVSLCKELTARNTCRILPVCDLPDRSRLAKRQDHRHPAHHSSVRWRCRWRLCPDRAMR